MRGNKTFAALSVSRGLSLLTVLLLACASVFAAAPAGASNGSTPDGAGYSAPDRVAVGQPLTVKGVGWMNQEKKEGSVVAVKIDGGTFKAKSAVKNPVNGKAETDKGVLAMVKADASGNWTVTISAESLSQLKEGKHTVQFSSGSGLQGDVVRQSSAAFVYGAEAGKPNQNPNPQAPAPKEAPQAPAPKEAAPPNQPNDTPSSLGPPEWPHVDLSDKSGAKAWVEKEIKSDMGAKFRIRGTGWKNSAGNGPSTVSVKINEGENKPYERAKAIAHPSVKGDKTVWALVAQVNPENDTNVKDIKSNGDFEVEIDVPKSLTKGQYFTVSLFSGQSDTKDVKRSMTSEQLTVLEPTTCTPSVEKPTVKVENAKAHIGGTVKVSGKGWCHQQDGQGASKITVKIDGGEYKRLDVPASGDATVWAIVKNADPKTGDWTAEIPLPDGTDKKAVRGGNGGSDPVFPEGEHHFTFITGEAVKPGDAKREVKSEKFDVGDYKPSGIPDPVEANEDLKDDNKQGMTVKRGKDGRLVVTVPKAKAEAGKGNKKDGRNATDKKTWVFLDVYDEEGTSRHPWGARWFETDKDGKVLDLPKDVSLPNGALKITAQSGKPGDDFGALLGWTTFEGPKKPENPTNPPGGGGNQPPSGENRPPSGNQPPSNGGNQPPGGNQGNGGGQQSRTGGSTIVRRSVQSGARQSIIPGRYVIQRAIAGQQPQKPAQPFFPKPDFSPLPPVPNIKGLTLQNAGNIGKQMEGKVLVLAPAGRQPGEWVFLYLYPQGSPLGWMQIDKEGKIRVDTSTLPDGSYKFALMDSTGALIGWTDLDVGNVKKSPAPAPTPTKADGPARIPPKTGGDDSQPIWPWMLGGAVISVTVVATSLIASRRQSK